MHFGGILTFIQLATNLANSVFPIPPGPKTQTRGIFSFSKRRTTSTKSFSLPIKLDDNLGKLLTTLISGKCVSSTIPPIYIN